MVGATTWFVLEHHSVGELWRMATTPIRVLSIKWNGWLAKLEALFPRTAATCRKVKSVFSIPMRASRAAVTVCFSRLSHLGSRMKGYLSKAFKKLNAAVFRKYIVTDTTEGSNAEGQIPAPASDEGKTRIHSRDEGNWKEGPRKRRQAIGHWRTLRSAVMSIQRWKSADFKLQTVSSPIDVVENALQGIRPNRFDGGGLKGRVDSLAFSPDGKLLAVYK